jgi:hypothetical protein
LVPIEPDAPGWLTMTMVWPSAFSSSAAVTRVTWSVDPPAAQGTIRLIGRVGFHCCAWAAPVSVRPMAQAIRVLKKRRVDMSIFLGRGVELTGRLM